MLLLFKIIEAKNGGKQMHPDDLLLRIVAALTPARIERLAEKHHLEPIGEAPWVKSVIGGSDDHAGIFIGHPHTECPKARNTGELLSCLRDGKTQVIGKAGSPWVVAHSIYSVGYKHLRALQSQNGKTARGAAWSILDHVLMQQPAPSKSRLFLSAAANAVRSRLRRRNAASFSPLVREAMRLLRENPEWQQTLNSPIPAGGTCGQKYAETVQVMIQRSFASNRRERCSKLSFDFLPH